MRPDVGRARPGNIAAPLGSHFGGAVSRPRMTERVNRAQKRPNPAPSKRRKLPARGRIRDFSRSRINPWEKRLTPEKTPMRSMAHIGPHAETPETFSKRLNFSNPQKLNPPDPRIAPNLPLPLGEVARSDGEGIFIPCSLSRKAPISRTYPFSSCSATA